MLKWIACLGALALVAGCSLNKDADAALTAMRLAEGKSGPIKYQSKSGSGSKVTLKKASIGEGDDVLLADTIVIDGLDLGPEGKPLFTGFAVNGISPKKAVEGVTFKLDKVAVKGANQKTGLFLASAFTEAGPGEPPPFAEWGFDKLSINGLTLNGDLAKLGMGSGAFNIQMAELSSSELKNTVLGSAIFSGFKGNFDVPAEAGAGFPMKGVFDFGNLKFTNVQGNIFATAFEAGFNSAMTGGEPTIDLASIVKSPIDPGYDTLEWTGMSFDVAGLKFTTSPMKSSAKRGADGVVTAVSSDRASMKLEAKPTEGELGANVGAVLSKLGYESVEIYGQGDFTFDAATDTTRALSYSFGATNGFDVKFSGGFIGLTKALNALMASANSMEKAFETIPEPDQPTDADKPADADTPPEPAEPSVPEPDLSGFEALSLIDLDLTLTDKSLVNRLLKLDADPEKLRADIVAQVEAMGPDLTQAGVEKAVSDELVAAVSAFVKQPGTLTLKLKPSKPVSMQSTSDPAALTKAALGFSATYTPPAAAPPPGN